MNNLESVIFWDGVFTIGKGITYILFAAACIKYLVS